jgi:hypothetical protein
MAGVAARARPRRSSVNFRRLKWCLVREAAFRILFPDPLDADRELAVRRRLNALDSDRVAARAGVALRLHPERSSWPPGTV